MSIKDTLKAFTVAATVGSTVAGCNTTGGEYVEVSPRGRTPIYEPAPRASTQNDVFGAAIAGAAAGIAAGALAGSGVAIPSQIFGGVQYGGGGYGYGGGYRGQNCNVTKYDYNNQGERIPAGTYNICRNESPYGGYRERGYGYGSGSGYYNGNTECRVEAVGSGRNRRQIVLCP